MLQLKLEDFGTIRFTSVPRGGAPLAIREQWIGVEVPCLFSHDGGSNEGEGQRDVVTGLDVPDYPGFIVLQIQALDALRKKSPATADYWNKQGFPNHDLALFLFSLESAEVVKPVITRKEFWQRYADA
jgi:hypothetical protein